MTELRGKKESGGAIKINARSEVWQGKREPCERCSRQSASTHQSQIPLRFCWKIRKNNRLPGVIICISQFKSRVIAAPDAGKKEAWTLQGKGRRTNELTLGRLVLYLEISLAIHEGQAREQVACELAADCSTVDDPATASAVTLRQECIAPLLVLSHSLGVLLLRVVFSFFFILGVCWVFGRYLLKKIYNVFW